MQEAHPAARAVLTSQRIVSKLPPSYHLVGASSPQGLRRRYEAILASGAVLSPRKQGSEFAGVMLDAVSYYAGMDRFVFLAFAQPCPYYLDYSNSVASAFGFTFDTEDLVEQGALVLHEPVSGRGDAVSKTVAGVLSRHGLSEEQVHLVARPQPPTRKDVETSGVISSPWMDHLKRASEDSLQLDSFQDVQLEVEAAAQEVLDTHALRGEAALQFLHHEAARDGSVEILVEGCLSLARAIGQIEAGVETPITAPIR